MTGPAPAAAWPVLVRPFDPVDRGTALVLIDLQAFDCRRDTGWGPLLAARQDGIAEYYYGRLEAAVLPTVARLLEAWRRAALPVVHVTVGAHFADGRDALRGRAVASAEAPPLPVVGTAAHAIVAEAAPAAGEPVLNKVTRSAFASTGLDAVLRRAGVGQLVLVGVLTNSCVESTARDASDRGYRVTIVEDGCASFDQASHEASLLTFRRIFGAVAGADAVCRSLTGLASKSSASLGGKQ